MNKKITALLIALCLAAIAFLVWGTASEARSSQPHKYYITVQQCGVPAGNYTAQPNRSLFTYNGAFKRANYIKNHWKVRSVHITNAFDGSFVAQLDTDYHGGKCAPN